MNKHPALLILLVAAVPAAAQAPAQTPAAAQTPALSPAQPPIRPIGAVFATSHDTLGIVAHMRALPGGHLLVNDVARRQVVLLDSTMSIVRVVADTTSGAAKAYGPRPGGLIAWKGDSTLFVDPASLSMLVIDPEGDIARVMSVPRAQEVNSLTSISFGTPALDADGRLVYRAFPDRQVRATRGPGGGPVAPPSPPSPSDSAAIVRLDLAARTLDTVAFIRIPKVDINMSRGDDGTVTVSQTINPLPTVDEWAVTSDGRVAVVRGRDYRVEWMGVAGAPPESVKIPFDWQRLTDDDKAALIDSVKAQRERMPAPGGRRVVFGGAPGAAAGTGAPPGGAAGGAPVRMTVVQSRSDGGAPAPAVSGGGNMQMNISFVSPAELPDYKPPFFAGALRADADGNLWVRTIPTRAISEGAVYDVIDSRGALVDRVQVPAGREIRGFGPGAIIYLTSHGDNGTIIEAARLR